MSDCRCGLADECDGEYATFYPLQLGGMCAIVPCYRPIGLTDGEWAEQQKQKQEKDY